MGDGAAVALQGLLASARKPAEGIIAAFIGVGLLILGASSVFGELQSALDRIWRVPEPEKSGGLWKLLRTRLVSFAMIIGIGLLLIASLLASALLAVLEKWWGTLFGGRALVASALNIGLSYLMVTVMFAMIYKIMPRVRTPGATFGPVRRSRRCSSRQGSMQLACISAPAASAPPSARPARWL